MSFWSRIFVSRTWKNIFLYYYKSWFMCFVDISAMKTSAIRSSFKYVVCCCCLDDCKKSSPNIETSFKTLFQLIVFCRLFNFMAHLLRQSLEKTKKISHGNAVHLPIHSIRQSLHHTQNVTNPFDYTILLSLKMYPIVNQFPTDPICNGPPQHFITAAPQHDISKPPSSFKQTQSSNCTI